MYLTAKPFAYPGWRLTVPGAPAGGHQKGHTHTNNAGVTVQNPDAYQLDRHSGVASHDSTHANQRNPRGVYRGPAETPPHPNASKSSNVVSAHQLQRHAGISVAPGSFLSPEDFFYHKNELNFAGHLGYQISRGDENSDRPMPGAHIMVMPNFPRRYAGTGATSTVAQPAPTPLPMPPSPSVAIAAPPPISPAPSPVVNTNALIPLGDGSGNYVNSSTGAIVPASQIVIGTTGQATIAPGSTVNLSSALAWLQQSTLISSLPNYLVVGGSLLALSMFSKGKR